jgi:hypothetical protein
LVEVEKIVEKPVAHYQVHEHVVEVPIESTKLKEVVKTIEVPIDHTTVHQVEVRVEVPVDRVQLQYTEVEVPVTKIQ